MERTLLLLNVGLYISDCGTPSGIVLNFSVCGTRFGIVLYIFCVWNVLWYCEISCYIILRRECTLVFWNPVLYFSTCGTRSDIVEFCVIFSACGTRSGIVEICVIFFARQWNALWYCGIVC